MLSLFVLFWSSKPLLQGHHVTICWQNMIHILQLYTPNEKDGDYRICKPSTFFKHESLCWHVYAFQDMTSWHSAGIYRNLFLPGSLQLVFCSTSSDQEIGCLVASCEFVPHRGDIHPKGEWSKAQWRNKLALKPDSQRRFLIYLTPIARFLQSNIFIALSPK